MKKVKISLSPLHLKKETILDLGVSGSIYGGATDSVGPNCNPNSIPPNCMLSKACPTNDMANPACYNPDTLKYSCQCPAESMPAVQCWTNTAACPQTYYC